MDDRTIDFLGGTYNNYHMGSLQVCRNMIYDLEGPVKGINA